MPSSRKPVNCSELAALLAKIAFKVADTADVRNFDDVARTMQGLIPGVDRKDIAESITVFLRAESAERPARAKTKTAEIRREARTEHGLKKQIDRLMGKVDELSDVEETPRTRREWNATIQELRATRNRLSRESNLSKQIDSLLAQIETGEFKPSKPRAKTHDAALEKLELQRDILRGKVRGHIQAMKPKGYFQRFVRAPFRALGSFITTGEFSAVLNQGGFVVFGNPRLGMKALRGGLSAFASQENEVRIARDLENRPNSERYRRWKLFLSTPDDILSQREESMMSHLLERIPLVKNFVRFHRTFLNVLRADSVDHLVDSFGPNGDVTDPEGAAIANFVNAATGRGKLGILEPAGVALADFAFAPRYYASRLQMLVGEPLWNAPTARIKKAVAMQYARYGLGLIAVESLMALAGADIEDDPRSSDWQKGRFDETRIHLLSGFQQWIVFATRILTGETKNSRGEMRSLRGETHRYGDRQVSDVIFSFLRSKSAPGLSFAIDVATGEDFLGRAMTPARLASRFAGPITYQDIYRVMTTDLSVPHKVALSTLAFMGAFVNVHTPIERSNR